MPQKQTIAIIGTGNSGFTPVQLVGIAQSLFIKVFDDLHQFEALDKTATLNETKNLI